MSRDMEGVDMKLIDWVVPRLLVVLVFVWLFMYAFHVHAFTVLVEVPLYEYVVSDVEYGYRDKGGDHVISQSEYLVWKECVESDVKCDLYSGVDVVYSREFGYYDLRKIYDGEYAVLTEATATTSLTYLKGTVSGVGDVVDKI